MDKSELIPLLICLPVLLVCIFMIGLGILQLINDFKYNRLLKRVGLEAYKYHIQMKEHTFKGE